MDGASALVIAGAVTGSFVEAPHSVGDQRLLSYNCRLRGRPTRCYGRIMSSSAKHAFLAKPGTRPLLSLALLLLRPQAQ
jgi:hypothetical protein